MFVLYQALCGGGDGGERGGINLIADPFSVSVGKGLINTCSQFCDHRPRDRQGNGVSLKPLSVYIVGDNSS
ncbi:hypothetical protein NPIL_248671 [Nephila pilipes]|uniref:Uncharacterized protein n=1 Tax=Nephila pilipes TaxID=299642 RepID=A0A8X6UN72_NEPPI|nr:hypothetical protein NPIL_248671 [Nephila pilipes]